MKIFLFTFFLGVLIWPADKKYNLAELCERIAIAESGNTHFYSNGDVVTNFNGTRFGVMQISIIVFNLYNTRTGAALPGHLITNEYVNRIIGNWYVRYLYFRCNYDQYKTANAYNMGLSRKFANTRYLKKVFGHLNFLKGQKIIDTWIYYRRKYPRYENFP